MKEVTLFESWVNSLHEETQLPNTTEKQQQLIQLLSEPLTVGADATDATESLRGVFSDDELSDQLHDLADTDPNADARPVVLARLNDFKNQPGIAAVIAKVQNASAEDTAPVGSEPGDEEAVDTATAPPAPAPQGGEAPAEEPVPAPEEPVAEDAEDDYDADLADILKNAGVEHCDCPAEDYLTGRDPHLKENSVGSWATVSSQVIGGMVGVDRLRQLAGTINFHK